MKIYSQVRKQANSSDHKWSRITAPSALGGLYFRPRSWHRWLEVCLLWVMGTEVVPLMGDWSSARGWKPEMLGEGPPAKEKRWKKLPCLLPEATTYIRLPTCRDGMEGLPLIREETKPPGDLVPGLAVEPITI